MAAKTVVLFTALAVVVSYLFVHYRGNSDDKVAFPRDGYFGEGQRKPDDTAIRPFKIDVPEDAIKELKERLTAARIGHEQLEDVNDFSYGFNLKTLLKFKDYWQTKYDWRKAEAELNSFPQFKTQIEGLQIHFLDVKPPAGKYQKVIPILLVHGWPGNVYEFHKIIPILTDPKAALKDSSVDFAFRVVAPSIPGYGWSEASHKSGLDQTASARIFKKLMVERLGLAKFVVQGGDWGSLVVSNVARMFPEHVYGVHLNVLFVMGGAKHSLLQIVGSFLPGLVFSDPELKDYSLKTILMEVLREMGYMHIQATKPDTVGVALNDSPIGLMAYILEKFSVWTNPNFVAREDGGLFKKFTMDELLTIVSIYWFNGNILSSQRYYKEFYAGGAVDMANQFIHVPVGLASLPHELNGRQPIELARTVANVTHFSKIHDGGHFAAFEMPKELAGDIFAFSKTVLPH